MRGRLEGVEPGVVEAAGQRPDLLDVDAVDLLDLVDEQVDERRVGQVDDQLVDRPAGAPLEDVDADDLAAHRADPAGHLPERTGAVGQPEADDEGLHARGTYGGRVNPVFPAGHDRERENRAFLTGRSSRVPFAPWHGA